MKEIKLIVGLGNKGKEYENTPHNIGFRVIDNLLSGTKFPIVKKFGGEIFENKDKSIIYLKPMTFMNNSGKTVSSIIAEYKIKGKLKKIDKEVIEKATKIVKDWIISV